MSPITVRRRTAAPPEELWARVADLAGHAPFVPLTTITAPPLDLGAAVVARTAVGPLHVDDRMVVTSWSPPPAAPARLRLVKTGRVLGGWAEIEVRAVPGGSEVRWTEEIRPHLPLRPRRLTDLATTAMIEHILDGVLSGLVPLPAEETEESA